MNAFMEAYLPADALGEPSTGVVVAPFRKRIHPVVAYLASLGSKESKRTTLSSLNTVARKLGATDAMMFDWTTIRPVHLEALRQSMLAAQSVKTVSKKISMVKSVLKRCFMESMISGEDWAKIQAVDGPRGKVLSKSKTGRMMSLHEISDLQAHLASHRESPAGCRDDALFSTALAGGCRRDELSKLTVGDFDPTNQTLDVHGKGNADRRQFIPQYAVGRIEAWLRWRPSLAPDAPLFCEVRPLRLGLYKFGSKHLSGNSLYKILAKRVSAAGVQPTTLHDLRRTYISLLLDAGVSLSDVRDMAGHTSAATTELYDRRGDKSKRSAAVELGRLLELENDDES